MVYVPTASLTLASGVRSRTLKRYAGAPVALFATQGRRHRKPVQMAARFVAPDLCVAQSAATVEQARLLGWPAELLPPGVDLATFRPVSTDRKAILRRQFGLGEDEFVVLHVGHLNRGRGVADLLAVTDLARPVLACSTSTPQDAELAGELRTKGVSVFSDYIPKIADLYAAADAYLFPVPPDPEGPSSIDVPLSVLEAAACGLPVVTTRFGALPDLWPEAAMEGMNGGDLLYYDDIDGLRRAVVRLRDARTGSAGAGRRAPPGGAIRLGGARPPAAPEADRRGNRVMTTNEMPSDVAWAAYLVSSWWGAIWRAARAHRPARSRRAEAAQERLPAADPGARSAARRPRSAFVRAI